MSHARKLCQGGFNLNKINPAQIYVNFNRKNVQKYVKIVFSLLKTLKLGYLYKPYVYLYVNVKEKFRNPIFVRIVKIWHICYEVNQSWELGILSAKRD